MIHAGSITTESEKVRCRVTNPAGHPPIRCVFVLPGGAEVTHIEVWTWEKKPQRAYIRDIDRAYGPLPQRPVFMLE